LDTIQPGTLLLVLALLILLSAFFSATETSMMALNRYRLRHLINKHHRGALRASRLLEKPDKLLGILLLGNTVVNILASSLATLLAFRLYGDTGVAVATFLLVFVLLIFAEIMPKTVAALYPETIAFPASLILIPLLKIFYPVLWIINGLSNGLLRLLRVNPHKQGDTHLTPDELRTVVRESGKLISPRYRSMLLNILDLDGMTVEDIMIPRNEIVGLNLDKDMPALMEEISRSEFTRLPVYSEDVNNIVGILHMKKVIGFMKPGQFPTEKSSITDNMLPPYFVPESTPLNIQLQNFQKEKRRVGVVVDEYGDVQGLVTLEDILEEIVGEFTTNTEEDIETIERQPNGSVIIDCSASLREINRALHWTLPTDGPKTLNGLVIEHLGDIPDNRVCFRIGDYCFEILRIGDNRVESVKAFERNKTISLFH
jgi:Mg2+/Co2+ transporter CorB